MSVHQQRVITEPSDNNCRGRESVRLRDRLRRNPRHRPQQRHTPGVRLSGQLQPAAVAIGYLAGPCLPSSVQMLPTQWHRYPVACAS